MSNPDCEKCRGGNYILIECCSGHECMCRGEPVELDDCPDCNPLGDKPMGGYLKDYKYLDSLEYIGKGSKQP